MVQGDNLSFGGHSVEWKPHTCGTKALPNNGFNNSTYNVLFVRIECVDNDRVCKAAYALLLSRF